ncbi:MAG: beta-propeller domain-containing protein, partial [Ruminococcus sp.]|nr:beta-propeller domain-containing protein [Ruminococcus sp.]
MKNNDERVKAILDSESVPEEISPENMKNMLDEKSGGLLIKDDSVNNPECELSRRKITKISVFGRIAASVAACAIIVGGTVGTMNLVRRSGDNAKTEYNDNDASREYSAVPDSDKSGDSENKNSRNSEKSGDTPEEKRIEPEQAAAPYMSGAESYEQVYNMIQEARRNSHSKRNELQSAETYGAFGDNADGAAPAAIEGSYDTGGSLAFNGLDESKSEANVEDSAVQESISVGGTNDFSETYNQEEGVLEADIVKTDGERIYYLYNDYSKELYFDSNIETAAKINISEVDGGEFVESYSLDISPEYVIDGDDWNTEMYVNEMYLYNDMIIVIGQANAWRSIPDESEQPLQDGAAVPYIAQYQYEQENQCFASVYTSENEPQLIGTYWQDGFFSDVRIAPDGYMYLVSTYQVYDFSAINDSGEPEKYIPECGTDNFECVEPCDILLPENELDNSSVLSYTVIGSVNLTVSGEFSNTDTKALAGYTGDLYCSADNIYTASGWDSTDITRISVGGGTIEPVASGTVEGFVRDQFSMSEYNGYFRVATTVETWTDNRNFLTDILSINTTSTRVSDNRVYVLDMDMNIVGSVGGFGENETIKSVNFDGDMGYVVTYEQTDPLFAIDLSDPADPFITDEFKILGYSTYMQKWADGQLLGFGADADEDGIQTGIKIVMFDNSDPYDLKEIGLYSVNREHDMQYVGSEGIWDRKALLIAPEKNLIGVPVNIND